MERNLKNSAGQIIDVAISIDPADETKNNLFVEPVNEYGKHWFQKYVMNGACGCVFKPEGFAKFAIFCADNNVVIGCK